MKPFLVALFIIYTGSAEAKIIPLPANTKGELYKPKHGAQPGDTLRLIGNYNIIYLEDIKGTPSRPIVIQNKRQVVTGLDGGYGLIVIGRHFIIDGTGDGLPYGIKIDGQAHYIGQGVGLGHSSHYEIKGVEITKAQVGFFSNPPTGYYKNIYIHHCYIHDLDNPQEGGRSEGFYIGNTGIATYGSEGSFDSVRIEHNRLDGLSGDGIQVARATNLSIQHNRISNYGKASLQDQNTGIILGGCSQGVVAQNEIIKGTGTAIQVFGAGRVIIDRNTIKETSRHPNCDAIYIEGKCTSGPPLAVSVTNNSIDDAVRDFIRDASHSVLQKKGNQLGRLAVGKSAHKSAP